MTFENILDSTFLQTLYPRGVDLTGEISFVDFSWDGPTVKLGIHITEMPLDAPKKWHADANRVVISLGFHDFANLSFTGMGRHNVTTLLIEKVDDRVQLQTISDEFKLSFDCMFVRQVSVEAYIDERG